MISLCKTYKETKISHVMHGVCLIFPGSKKTAGEFFNPGLNCSDILDQRDDAKDGFYWVTLNPLNPVKVGYYFTFFSQRVFP